MEISLSEPYQCKPLCDLPKAIGYHGSEKFDDKVFIFGGKDEKKTYDDVVLLDLATNKCEIISKLPRPLRRMGTVRCEHKVIFTFLFYILRWVTVSYRSLTLNKIFTL